MFRSVFIVLFCLGCTAPVFAQTIDPNALDNLTKQQKTAEEKAGRLDKQEKIIRGEISSLKQDLVKASAQSRGYEVEAAQIQTQISKLESEESSIKAIILQDRETLANLLAALQRVKRNPPPTLLTSSKNAIDTVRAANLMASISRDLQQKSQILSARLTDLESVQNKMGISHQKYRKNARAIDTRRTKIKSILKDKSKLRGQLSADQKTQTEKAKKLAAEADSLRDLIARFEEQAENITPRLKPDIDSIPPVFPSPRIKPERGQAPPPLYVSVHKGRFADARGKLSLPVLGRLSRRYGSKLKNGSRAKGVYLRTAPNAQVVAPFAGRIEFSGRFNGGNVVILNVSNGYFIVLTGLAGTFTSAGELVKAGEPLGNMPLNPNAKPELFMEFRKNKTSIDPMPWISKALKG